MLRQGIRRSFLSRAVDSVRDLIQKSVERQWYGVPTWLWCLLPLNGLFILISWLRKRHWTAASRKVQIQPSAITSVEIPVIVVGNLSVGGTGKTPVIIALTKYLSRQGYKPGVVSRGYGRQSKDTLVVGHRTTAVDAGDEPLLISRTTRCPVAVGKRRPELVNKLIQEHGCNVILSDDGLQHYPLRRDVEIVVVDGSRGFGNGWRLPVGPLREPLSRLQSIDWLLVNGDINSGVLAHPSLPEMQMLRLQPRSWLNVKTGEVVSVEQRPWQHHSHQQPLAIAGIGHPQRFFSTLEQLDIPHQSRAFPDHHQYTETDFIRANLSAEQRPVLMTTKDAVKCQQFAEANWWALVVEAELPNTFLLSLLSQVAAVAKAKSS